MPFFLQARNTAALTAFELVAAITRNTPFTSLAENSRRIHFSFRARACFRISATARGLTTVISGPWPIRPAIFSAAIFPAPTTRHFRPARLTIMGKNVGVSLGIVEKHTTATDAGDY